MCFGASDLRLRRHVNRTSLSRLLIATPCKGTEIQHTSYPNPPNSSKIPKCLHCHLRVLNTGPGGDGRPSSRVALLCQQLLGREGTTAERLWEPAVFLPAASTEGRRTSGMAQAAYCIPTSQVARLVIRPFTHKSQKPCDTAEGTDTLDYSDTQTSIETEEQASVW